MMTELMAAGSPEDKVAKQADLVKLAFEKALSNARRSWPSWSPSPTPRPPT